MVELIINGMTAVLYDNFSFRYVRENPMLTQSSDFTYDITLPLADPNNIRIFGYIYPQWATKPDFKHSASIRINGSTLISGVVVPLEVTETDLKMQLLAGNSEFNYTVKDDLYITDLDLPVVPNIGNWDYYYDDPNATNTPWPKYPEGNYVLAPIVNTTTGELINPWVTYRRVWGETTPRMFFSLSKEKPKAIQPYLCAMIREIFKSIGYRIVSNVIEDTPFSQLYICNSSITQRWQDVLPHWTIKEFIDNLSTLFQVDVIVTGTDVSIIRKPKEYSGIPIELTEIIDEYESKEDAEESPGKNPIYDFGSEDVDSIDYLPNEIMEYFKEKHFSTYEEMRDWYIGDGINAKKTLLRLNDKTYAVFNDDLKQIDQWGRLNLGFKNDVKIGIVPGVNKVSAKVTAKTHTANNTISEYYENKMITATPGSSVAEQNINYDQELSVQSYLEDDLGERYYPDRLYVSFIAGFELFRPTLLHMWIISNPITYQADLRLQLYPYSIGRLFFANYAKFSTREYTIKFLGRKIPPMDRPFLINGKKYVCKRIEADITEAGISEVLQGIFYEIEQ